MIISLLCLALAYELPDADRLAEPTAAEKQRIAQAMAALRDGEPDDVEAAVRELALVGEPALRGIVKRLNEADARERLLLLTAVRPMARAAPLIEQAQSDASPAVRAWTSPPPRPPAVPIAQLARDYLEALAVVDEVQRRKADADARRANFGLEPATESEILVYWRDGMADRELGSKIEARRLRAKRRFAIVGGEALAAGTLKPDLSDGVFVAYLALLNEEEVYHAACGLTGAKESVAPVLRELLQRPNHEPKLVLRVLFAVDAKGVAEVFARRADYPEETQRALVRLAPDHLAVKDRVPWLEAAALAKYESVRIAALSGLLDCAAPAGRPVAARLLDPAQYGAGEFRRAARLLARADEPEPLVQPALMDIPDDNSGKGPVLEALRRECRAALKDHAGKKIEDIAVRLLRHEARRVRALAIEWVKGPAALLEFASGEQDSALATTAALRALDRSPDGGIADEVLALLERRGLKMPWSLVRVLQKLGRVDLLVDLARGRAGRSVARQALRAITRLERIDSKWENALFELCAGADPELAADLLLSLGSEEAYRRLEALAADADAGLDLPAAIGARDRLARPVSLERFLEGADASRLEDLVEAARAVGDVEPGLFEKLFRAWDKLPLGEREGDDPRDSGALEEKTKVLKWLAHSRDVASARSLLRSLLADEIKDPSLVLGVLRAAAKLLPAKELSALIAPVRKFAAEERADENGLAPRFNQRRRVFVFFGLRALAWARVPGTADLCADIFLDPRLHPAAFSWKTDPGVAAWAFQALRHVPTAEAGKAFRAALARAEADGRLARMHPRSLRDALAQCRQGRDRGRWLAAVGAALGETLMRLPWEDETGYLLGQQYGAQRRYALAATAMRADAARKRIAGFVATDGFWSPWRLEERARLYEAIGKQDKEAVRSSIRERIAGDPMLSYWAAIQALWQFGDVEGAEEALARAVQRTGGLHHPFREWLAAVRLRQGRTQEALRLLDPEQHLPIRRRPQGAWYLLFTAQAHARLGDTPRARQELELALVQDRRLIATAKTMPEFKEWADVFAEADQLFFDKLFEYGG